MAHKSSYDRPLSVIERMAVASLGLYLCAVGARALAGGHFLYRNYVHTPVLAPLALAIGAILIVGAVMMRR